MIFFEIITSSVMKISFIGKVLKIISLKKDLLFYSLLIIYDLILILSRICYDLDYNFIPVIIQKIMCRKRFMYSN